MQGTKRSLDATSTTNIQSRKIPFVPNQLRKPFPPRGTGNPLLKANSSTIYTDHNEEEVDYNDIQSLRAFAIRHQSQYHENEYEPGQTLQEQANEEQNIEEQHINSQDADWESYQEL
jgi:hypothetical protein